MKWLEDFNHKEEKFSQVLAFEEYMKIFEDNAKRELRTTACYLKDMFDFYGRGEKGGFNLFKKEHPESSPIYGQHTTQDLIYRNLENFYEEGANNKFILLVGPNGSSKSSLVKKIMRCLEDYSQDDSAPLYSFSWVFPIDNYVKGSVGLATPSVTKNIQSYAHLEDKEISAILPSDLKDHPILLIPLEARQRLINETLKDDQVHLDFIKKTYLYHGDLSKRNRMIFDALLKNYKGEYLEVLKHIRVERFYIDKRYSIGAATIEPQVHVDARLQQITMDKRLSSLPPSLQSLNLFSISGEVVLGNRGILEFSDLLKRPLDAFKYLLMTMESKTVNLQGILTELDIFFVGSSNEVHFNAFKQHPDFNSFRGRFNFIKVPYLLKYQDEEKIYSEQISQMKNHVRFEPLALKALCLWGVMTRFRAPLSKNYQDEKTGKMVADLNPLQKAILLSEERAPEHLDSEEKQILKRTLPDVFKEYQNDTLYEGKFGISPREMKNIIYELSSLHETISFVEVLEYLNDLSEMKNDHDFLNIAPQGEYHNSKKFIGLINEYSLDVLDNQVRDCLGLVDERSYEDYISRYIMNVNSLIKGEKIKNKVTGKFEPSDMYFINEFESNINLKESPEKFRSHLISKLGAHSLDNPGKGIVYSEVFSDIAKLLQEFFRKEQKKIIDKVAKNIVFYLEDLEDDLAKKNSHQLNQEIKTLIGSIVEKLQSKFNYSQKGAINSLKYLIKERY